MSGFLDSIQELQQLFGVCPCCGEVFRLSDARLFLDLPPPKTVFDKLEDARARLERQLERFDEQEEAIREAATEKGRKAAARRMRKLLPFLSERRVHPQDVKALFSPVRYVAFPGMNDGTPRGVQFYDATASTTAQERVQESLAKALADQRFSWLTLHVAGDGTVTTTEG